MSETSVAEQIAAAQTDPAVPEQTQRAAKMALLTPEQAQAALSAGAFEGASLTDQDLALLQALAGPEAQPSEDTSSLLDELAKAALAPELESLQSDLDPNLDNPMAPKGSAPDLSEEEKSNLIESQKKANNQTLKNHRRSAKEWIAKKKGAGVLLARDEDGSLHCLVLGDEEKLTNVEITIDNPLYSLIMTLVLSHLPGASVNSQMMHAKQLEGMNHMGNNLMAGLQATNNNVLQLAALMKLKFPELQMETQAMAQTKSGIIIPG